MTKLKIENVLVYLIDIKTFIKCIVISIWFKGKAICPYIFLVSNYSDIDLKHITLKYNDWGLNNYDYKNCSNVHNVISYRFRTTYIIYDILSNISGTKFCFFFFFYISIKILSIKCVYNKKKKKLKKIYFTITREFSIYTKINKCC